MKNTQNLTRNIPSKKQTRRQFLETSTRTGAFLIGASIVPSTVLGRNGSVAPNERILMGGIGIGSRGTVDLRMLLREPDMQFLAICDPRKSRRAAVKALVDEWYENEDCTMYRDIHEFLAERTDIDAVLITTGDRWHALASVLAMRAGKDTYTEKPSSMTIAEGQAVVATAKRYGRVYQTGAQRLSEKKFTFANELLRTGRLGEIHTVRAQVSHGGPAVPENKWRPEQPLPPSEELNWDAWLGPVPWRPYNSDYVVKRAWRYFFDLHTGCTGEWGSHTFSQCQVALGAVNTSPVEYHYIDNPYGDGMVTKFANGVKMVLHRDWNDLEKKYIKYWHGACGVRYEGTEGWVSIAGGYDEPEVSSPALLADFDKLVNDYMARTQRPMNHWRDFLNCVKSRRPTVANEDVMHRSMSTVHAVNICLRLKRDMKYDPVKEEFINDPEANRLRSRAQREPWIM